MCERVRLYLRHEPTCFQSHGWCLGETDPDCKECTDIHPRPVCSETGHFFLRTFMYEVMAIVNSRPLSLEHISDPVGPEPLTPNHILTMKSTIIAPPPGEFVREDLYLRKDGREFSFWRMSFGPGGEREYLLSLQQRNKWNKNGETLR